MRTSIKNSGGAFASYLPRTRTLMTLLAMLALITVIACYISITRESGLSPNRSTLSLLTLLGLLLLICTGLVGYRAFKLWTLLKTSGTGSKLQMRLVAVFSVVTILPTIIVSIFSALFFNQGIESWFNERVSTALEESVQVAESYLKEHEYTIRGDAVAMADDIDREFNTNIVTPDFMNNIINTQTALRSLSSAALFQQGHIVAQSHLSFSLAFEHISEEDLELARQGEIVVKLEGQDKIRAIIKLKSANAPDTYLIIERLIDSKVVTHMSGADNSVVEYRKLKANIISKQVQFFIVFIVLALMLLFTAMWYGMVFATRLITPITNLVQAAERVRAGDFTVTVAEGKRNDEITTLARAFNRMTSELEKQRTDLVEVNRQLDTRRRFSEAVLSGVSAGVVALTRFKVVTLANPTAGNLLLLPAEMILKGKIITDIIPEFSDLLKAAEEKPDTLMSDKITITRRGKSHVLHVRIAVEKLFDTIDGYIVTFDDITELLAAQRSAAWSDVARRVAHEIKNPLTPIMLSTERLRKKYLPAVPAEAESFTRYLDTITKHIGDIGKIVEEFVTYARMPAPSLKSEDITSIIRKAVFSEQTTHADIVYETRLPDRAVAILCDEQQISRVLLNVMKNAAEALESLPDIKGAIRVECKVEGNICSVSITDNGPGFPADKMTRLLEPYVTTRAKGTGLGLAIVKKILDDHKARLNLENAPEGGASVIMVFAIENAPQT